MTQQRAPQAPPRVLVGLRIAAAGIEQVDLLAAEVHASRSAVIRALVSEGLKSQAIKQAVRNRLSVHD